MGPAQAIRTCLAKSFQFSGRASRSEFWWFVFTWSLPLTGLFFMFCEPKTVLASLAFPLALIPTASATIRRLRDADSAAWITFGPALWIVGWPLLFYIDNMKFESAFLSGLYDAYAIVVLFIGPIIFTVTMPILLMMLSLAPPNSKPLSK